MYLFLRRRVQNELTKPVTKDQACLHFKSFKICPPGGSRGKGSSRIMLQNKLKSRGMYAWAELWSSIELSGVAGS